MPDALQGIVALPDYAGVSEALIGMSLLGQVLVVFAGLAAAPALWYFARKRRDLRLRWLIDGIAVLVMMASVAELTALSGLWNPPREAVSLVVGSTALLVTLAIWLLVPQLLPATGELRAAYRALSHRHRELMQSQKRLSLLVDTAAEGVLMLDADGTITFANAAIAEMLGSGELSLSGRSILEFILPEDRDEGASRFLKRLYGARHRSEFRLVRTDGTLLYVVVSSGQVVEPDGTVSGLCCMFTDISDRERMAQQLQRLNLELGQRVEERTRALEETNRELAREMVVREYVQTELAASNDRLNRYLQALRDHTEDIRKLNQLSDALHSCDSAAAMVPVLEGFCSGFFDSVRGALYQRDDEAIVRIGPSWGGIEEAHPDLEMQIRLTVRRNEPWPASAESQAAEGPWLLCIPLHARGAAVGVLALSADRPFWAGDPTVDQNQKQVVRALAEHVALAGYNLTLLEQLREQSFSDPLTGLYNRRYLNAQVEREMAAYERTQQSFAVMLIDLDHFKQVNDNFGHDVGDEALRAVARVLLAQTRKTDICCRLGGEEFVVLLPGAAQDLAVERAEIVREAVRAMPVIGLPEDKFISISIGVSVYPYHGDSMLKLLRAADQALYLSKRSGRNRTSLASTG